MRRFGSFLSILGLLTLLVGLIAYFVVVPRAKRLPADTDTAITYDGVLSTALNPEALAEGDLPNLFLTDVPITVDRQVTVRETDGNKALIQSEAAVLAPDGSVIQATDSWYTVDRQTMLSIENFSDNPNPQPREGLVSGFPIGTEQRDYVGWNGESEETNPLRFVAKEEREGTDVYHFTSESGPDRIANPDPSALPPALPKAQLIGLVGTLGLPEDTANQLAGALELAPDPVPLAYTFSYNRDFYVDPATGIVIDYNTNESRTGGIEIAGSFQPLLEVWNLTFEQSDDSITAAKADADEAGGTLFWLGTILPWGLMIGGGLLALVGLWTRLKHRPDTDVDGLSGAGSGRSSLGGRSSDTNDLTATPDRATGNSGWEKNPDSQV